MSNPSDYTWWRAALAGDFGPMHDGHPECGYYRNKSIKHGIDQPVAIWKHDGKIVARVGYEGSAKMVEPDAIWTFVCRAPITAGAYNAANEAGAFEDAPAPIGHNLSNDPREALAMELEGEAELAERFLAEPIQSREQADRAATWATKLSGIAKSADDQRKVAKQPHLDAGKEVDAAWNPIRDSAKDLSNRLKRHLDPYLRQKAAAERERQAKAEAEAKAARDEAERVATEAQAAANSGDEEAAAKSRIAQEHADADARAAEQTAKARNAQAGYTGGKVALRKHTYATITNFDTLLVALKERPEVRELVETLANRAARSGVELPGMEIETMQRAA